MNSVPSVFGRLLTSAVCSVLIECQVYQTVVPVTGLTGHDRHRGGLGVSATHIVSEVEGGRAAVCLFPG